MKLNKFINLVILAFLLASQISMGTKPKPRKKKPNQPFKASQLKNERVKDAFLTKKDFLDSLYKTKGINFNEAQIFIRIFKLDKELELWAKNKNEQNYTLIYTYQVCAISGKAGPKSRAGDLQIPEGIYEINRYNPKSNYYLSLGINYPNQADKIRAGVYPTGGDIFIHGDCVTIGCVPLTDEKIKELYVCAVQSKEVNKTNVRVEIFPSRLTEHRITELSKSVAGGNNYRSLWEFLRESYDFFNREHMPLNYSINSSGAYVKN